MAFESYDVGQFEVHLVGEESLGEEDFDFVSQELLVDADFFGFEVFGDGCFHHGLVHGFVHIADAVESGEGPVCVSDADGLKVELLCFEEVDRLVVKVFFELFLGKIEGAGAEFFVVDLRPIVLGHGCGVVWSFLGELFVGHDGEPQEWLCLRELVEVKECASCVCEGIDAVFGAEVSLEEGIIDIECLFPLFGVVVTGGQSEPCIEEHVGSFGLELDHGLVSGDRLFVLLAVFLCECEVVPRGVDVFVFGEVFDDAFVQADSDGVSFGLVHLRAESEQLFDIELFDAFDFPAFDAKQHGSKADCLFGFGVGAFGCFGFGFGFGCTSRCSGYGTQEPQSQGISEHGSVLLRNLSWESRYETPAILY